jgi:excisionase family DNA binding protein
MDSIQANLTGRGVPRIALNPDEAATSAGVSRTRIFRAIRDRELTCRKSGKASLIELSELRRWIRSLPTRGRRAARDSGGELLGVSRNHD